MEQVVILDNAVTDGVPVQGVCEGRIVAYWPAEYDTSRGIRAVGSGGYIPAMIVAAWNSGQAIAMPCANLRLFVDPANVVYEDDSDLAKSSCTYSTAPAKGCWTWIPKA